MAGYIFLCTRLIKTTNKSWDVLELRLNLVPYYFKFIGLAVIIVAIVIYVWILKEKGIDRAEEAFLFHLNLGFLLLLFSREKYEDELYNQIRLKAIVASFIGILLCYGMIIPSVSIMQEMHHEWIQSFGAILVLFNLGYLIYFYSTKLQMRK
ncbi:hypothetical protein [uncultured Draconibacterium sp.]|uniref:hypothetical protein n=1 Tax=uncultured Draconibacterium sp. TaxID=1573823 RepID=UPI0029C94D31|nr:hypothetical protein [uncultured Draconibacterium sp.]